MTDAKPAPKPTPKPLTLAELAERMPRVSPFAETDVKAKR